MSIEKSDKDGTIIVHKKTGERFEIIGYDKSIKCYMTKSLEPDEDED